MPVCRLEGKEVAEKWRLGTGYSLLILRVADHLSTRFVLYDFNAHDGMHFHTVRVWVSSYYSLDSPVF